MSTIRKMIQDKFREMRMHDYLRETVKDAGYSHSETTKTPMGTKVALHVTRPGLVIGRKGSGIRAITETLGTEYELKNPQITVKEIQTPELSPSVMCNRMASHIERGTAFRRATMWTLKQVMENGALGVQITISGKLRGDRSAFEKHTAGILPRAGHHADQIVEEDIAHVQTPMGLIGVRIRIAKKDRVVKEFDLSGGPAAPKAAPAEAPAGAPAGDAKGRTGPDAGADAGADAGDAAAGTDGDAAEPGAEVVEVDGAKVEVVKAPGDGDGASSESEAIAIEEERMKSIETHDEAEEAAK
ncbi:MAG: 30S ribosomal protein S3 [Nitrosopumilus sp.]|nr:30S ribosomal protein S3 [Nitrosopumilus sp.]MDA7943660.1 30S ribosomal protein S3 [Nitrosopumilus sp.]MDA7999594.1 30S ribosomal protein S3 [Nitrosopumilus sp.]